VNTRGKDGGWIPSIDFFVGVSHEITLYVSCSSLFGIVVVSLSEIHEQDTSKVYLPWNMQKRSNPVSILRRVSCLDWEKQMKKLFKR